MSNVEMRPHLYLGLIKILPLDIIINNEILQFAIFSFPILFGIIARPDSYNFL